VAERRGLAARIGVTLLNLLEPGLGLLRIGQVRRALVVYAVSTIAILIFSVMRAAKSDMGFAAYAVTVGQLLALSLGAVAVSMWWTWRDSRVVSERQAVWSRWYAVVGALLIAFGLSWVLTVIGRNSYRNFYVPSEAMEPTLYKNDRFVASMHRPFDLHRGELILVKAPGDAIYVKRLAALPGDTVELKNGVVSINSVVSELIPEGTTRVSYSDRPAAEARLYRERFPGEAGFHHIQDLGTSETDDVLLTRIPPNHVFVLGDNRDDSADSRVPKAMGGLELVPIQDVMGRALFMYWPREKMGRSLRGDR